MITSDRFCPNCFDNNSVFPKHQINFSLDSYNLQYLQSALNLLLKRLMTHCWQFQIWEEILRTAYDWIFCLTWDSVIFYVETFLIFFDQNNQLYISAFLKRTLYADSFSRLETRQEWKWQKKKKKKKKKTHATACKEVKSKFWNPL